MIKSMLIIILLFTNMVYAKTIIIDEKTQKLEILSSSEIYIDKTQKLTINDITKKNIKFEKNDKELLSYGYSPDFNVWIKFTVKNDSDKAIQKILEYGNSMTTDIVFYDIKENIIQKEGLLNVSSSRSSINPIFNISLNSKEIKTYYINASSHVTTMIITLNIWNNKEFYTQEIKHQIVLSFFFGSMMILAVYNLFIFLFSRDLSYFYYTFYIVGVIIHQLMYVGIANLYLINNNQMEYVLQYAVLVVLLPIITLAFFIKHFINLKQYNFMYKTFKFMILITLCSIIILPFMEDYIKYRNLLPIGLASYLFFISIYATYNRNRQAFFICIGWLLIFSVTILMYLTSLGIINIHNYIPYIVEIAFVVEAVLFSVALSDKINTLQKEKIGANQELINQKKTENERLEIQVVEKTKDLNLSLEEKTLLLQELNHRVKNNMQMIISLIRLQANDIDDVKIQSLFITTQNRLNTMSELHELLYQKEDISYINTYEYFTTLIEGLQETYTQDIKINYSIDTNLQTEQAISCGIILNELVTNSLKYAFPDENKKDKCIDLFFSKLEDSYALIVKDNGIGYDQKSTKNSFGLILVTTLVESKLLGDIHTDTQNGVETIIIWGEEDED